MATKAAVEKMPDTDLRRLIAKYKGDKPVTVMIEMTPAMAADALSRNDINRPVRERHRAFLARQITEGRWRKTHQGIAFSPDGLLLDGQHRLLAVTDAGIPVTMSVTFNLDRDAFHVIDFGNVPRTLADVTRLDAVVLQPVTFLYRMAQEGESRGKFDVADFAPFWAAFGEDARALRQFCQQTRRVLSAAPIRAAAIYVAKATGDDTEPFFAYRTLVMQDYGNMPPSLQALNRQLIDRDIRSSTERFVRAASAFEKQDVGRIQIRDIFAKAADYRAKIAAIAKAHENKVWKLRPA
jgi:hypothetical protein